MPRTLAHQFELFSAPQGKEKLSLPQWQALPEGIRQTLSELMAQLLLDHVGDESAPLPGEMRHDA